MQAWYYPMAKGHMYVPFYYCLWWLNGIICFLSLFLHRFGCKLHYRSIGFLLWCKVLFFIIYGGVQEKISSMMSIKIGSLLEHHLSRFKDFNGCGRKVKSFLCLIRKKGRNVFFDSKSRLLPMSFLGQATYDFES